MVEKEACQLFREKTRIQLNIVILFNYVIVFVFALKMKKKNDLMINRKRYDDT